MFKQLEKKYYNYTLEELKNNKEYDIWQNYLSEDYCNMSKTAVVEPVLITGIYSDNIQTCIIEGKKVVMGVPAEPIMLIEFKNNKFPLTGCELLPQLNGKYYKDLPKELQNKLNNLKIEIVEYTNYEEVKSQKVLIQ